MLIASTVAPAQTGPGGVGNSDGSGGQPKNVIWLDASTLTTLSNGDPVTAWADQSGNGLDFGPLGTDATPVFRNDGLSGSAPVVRFDGTERYLKLDDNDQIDNDLAELTILIVARHKALNGNRGLLSKRLSGGQRSYSIFTSNSKRLNFDTRNSNDNRLVSPTVLSENTDYIHTVKYDGGKQYAYLLGIIDESQDVSGSGSVNNSTSNLILGTLNENYAPYFDGDIAEIIMYDQALSNADRLIVENYLSQKYGITITQDFFGNSANYDDTYFTDLRGIGSDGTTPRTNSLASDALTIRESNGSLDANEFVLFAHNETPHANNVTTEIADATNVTDRWARDWYVEVNQGGGLAGVDGGDVSIEMAFDFSTSGLGSPSASSDYVLLYRSTATGDFNRVVVDSYQAAGANTIVANVPASRLKTGYYTLGRGNALIAKTWYVFQDGNWNNPNTWTTDASTAPLFKNNANEIPTAADEVIIRSGKTVTIQPGAGIGQDNQRVNAIKVDGNLNITTSKDHNFTTINGSGTIRIAGYDPGSGLVDNFPDGTITGNIGFADADNGGTVIIDAAADVRLNATRTFRNLQINLPAAANKVVLGADLTLNGNFTITRGGFQFGDDATAANRTLTVSKNVTVATTGRITTANTNQRHTFTLEGNFTNDGNVRFTNRANFASDADRRSPSHPYYQNEATNGIVDVIFANDNADQTVNCRNITYFYRVVVDKGADATYKLSLKANDANNFRLLGFASDNVDSDGQTATQNTNAFALVNGTAEIGGNVEIPVLNRVTNYAISSTTRLWINGGDVRKTSAIAIVPYGTVQVSSGYLEATGNSGLTIRANGQIVVEGGSVSTNQIRTSIQGSGSLGGYRQSGGTVTVDGSLGGAENKYYLFSLTYPGNVFIMSGGTLRVRGAVNPSGSSAPSNQAHGGLIFINSDPGNQSVTGGTVIAEVSTANGPQKITSRAPFYNFTVTNTINSSAANAKIAIMGGTSGDNSSDKFRTLSTQDLIVRNDLTIETGTIRTSGSGTYGGYLDLCPDGISCANLEVGKNLTIEDSGVLDVFTNSTDNANSATVTFSGATNGIFYIGNITTYTNALTGYSDPGGSNNVYGAYRLPLHALVIDKPSATLTLQANGPVNDLSGANVVSGNKNVQGTKSRLLYVRDRFALRSGSTLNQIDPDNNGLGYSIRLYTNSLELDGDLFVYEQGVNPTNAFVEFGGNNGTITIDATPTSSIGNIAIELLNDEIKLTSDLYVKRFGYRHGGVNLGTYNLKIDVLDLNPEDGGNNDNFRLRTINNGDNQNREFIFGVNDSGANQFFYTTGAASDGGLSLKMPRQTNVDGTDGTDNVSADPSFNSIHYEYQNRNLLWFPVGVDGKYTPAVAYLHTNGTTSGDEYITVRPVDKVLQTTELSGGDVLSYYWNVDFEGYNSGEEPTVSWLFQYDETDIDAGNESIYVPGKVLDGGDYTRSDDGIASAVRDGGDGGKQGDVIGNNPRNIILFNGATVVATDDIDGATHNRKVFNTPPASGSGQVDSDPTNTNWSNALPGTGFALENANYTAGAADRFVGAPRIFYSKEDGSEADWDEGASWNSQAEITAEPVGSPGVTDEHDDDINQIAGNVEGKDYPGTGDIAILGVGPDTGTPHSIRIERGITAGAAELRFVENATITQAGRGGFAFRPELTINSDGGVPTLAMSSIKGVGIISDRRNTDPDFSNVDLGDYVNQAESFYMVENFQTSATYKNLPATLPNLLITSDNFGDNDRTAILANDHEIMGDLLIVGGANLALNSDNANPNNGDLVVNGNLQLINGYEVFPAGLVMGDGGNADPVLFFPGSNGGNVPSRTIDVYGDLIFMRRGSSVIINNAGGNNASHTLSVYGNITDNSEDTDGGIDLYDNTDHVNLIMKGSKSVEFSRTNTNASSTPELYTLTINKTDITNEVSVNTDIDLPLPTTISQQPIEILNGLLVLNDPSIDLTLTDASTGNFLLPNTANPQASSGSGGLEIRQGVARINGNNTGIILDGLLRVSGGELDLDDGNNNNFIEYSSSGEAQIEVTDGTLTVGSQIRRGINSTTGVLQYAQSGGTVLIGKNNFGVNSRGIFEVTNPGSSFEYTGGSFTIARDNNSPTVPSLLLDPATSNVADKTIITLGNGDTPVNQDLFGIRSSINVARLEVASANLDVSVYGIPLSVDSLSITTGATFNANGYDITINKTLVNDGDFATSGNTTNKQQTRFPSAAASSISGSGTTTFWNFTKSGGGTLGVSKDVNVANNAFIYAGTLNTQTSAFNLKKDLVHDATHTSAAAGPGIVFNGTQQQNLDRTGPGTSEVGVMNLDNAAGLIIGDTEENFRVNQKLTLTTGVFDMGGNLLIFPENAFIENGTGGTAVTDFNKNNMIQTNSSIRDFGVRKYYNAVSGGNVTFTYPVGLVAYTPVVVTINDASAGYITARPVNDTPPITEDTENTGSCADPDITDADNVLQYYWIVKTDGITGFNGDFKMYYDPNDIRVDGSIPYTVANYGPARLYNSDNMWDKVFTTADFDESIQRIRYPFVNQADETIEGIYTAGVTLRSDGTLLCGGAIPDVVPEFITKATGSGNFYDAATYQGGVAPKPGETPDIIIQGSYELLFNQNSIRTRKVTIEASATLVIQNGTNNHNLGFVTGEGTLRLESNGTTALFPTGDYEEFFPDLSCSGGGGLEYAGTGSYTVLADLPTLRRVTFSGSGTRTFPNNFALKVCENFHIANTVQVVIPDANNVTTVLGNVNKSDGAKFDNGGGTLTMGGSAAQLLVGDFTGSNALGKLRINNPAGVTIVNAAVVDADYGNIGANRDVELEDELILSNGKVTTNADNYLRLLTGATTSQASSTSFVNGPLQAVLNDNDNLAFPVGKSNRFGQVSVNDATHDSQTLVWQAEYFNSNPQTDNRVTNFTSDDPSIVDISEDEYWIVSNNKDTAPSGPTSAIIGLRWDVNSAVPVAVGALKAMAWNGPNSVWNNRGGTAHNATAKTFLSADHVSFGSERIMTLGGTEEMVQPVELISFTANAQEQTVQLVWETATEIDNDYFEVQRSVDGINFKKIGEVAGNGNTTDVIRYEFTDQMPVSGISYYQLKQVDFNGVFEYSDKISVEWISTGFVAGFVEVNLYPNPAPQGQAKLKVTGLRPNSTVTFKLLDMFGKPHLQQVIETDQLSQQGYLIQPRTRLASGVYVVSVQQGNEVHQKTLIVR